MKFAVLISFITLFLQSSFSQVEFLDTTGALSVRMHEGEVSDSAGNVYYSYRGMLVFRGPSFRNEDIAYLVRSTDIFSAETGKVLDARQDEVFFIITYGTFYRGSRVESSNLILRIKREQDTLLSIYSSGVKNPLFTATLPSGDFKPDNTGLIALLIALSDREKDLPVKPEIDDYLVEKGVIGVMRPYVSSDPYYEWTWDGRIMKPRFGHRPDDEWVSDGNTVRPYWAYHNSEEWMWDGEKLVLYMMGAQETVYLWDGRELRPALETKLEDEWIIEDNKARPKWSVDFRYQWVIEGDMPIPLIALVVLGFADR